ncbi:hypothetical protein [Actinomadura sp. WMMB 499]|uniref:hypothetical protein n=1 Tax=Actinomadura sp. WMMB 499 TaxID=1219491 RepID=UPI00124748FF|nr:hypothetical protein [Actinomadura sp. WMMB 499]QFG24576.1 hypothetical protein F7P10_29015 [Actinomadura sp. WMMB 499]
MRKIILLLATTGAAACALLAAAPPAAADPVPAALASELAADSESEPEPTTSIEYGAPDGTGNGGLVDFDDEVVDASDLGKIILVLN